MAGIGLIREIWLKIISISQIVGLFQWQISRKNWYILLIFDTKILTEEKLTSIFLSVAKHVQICWKKI